LLQIWDLALSFLPQSPEAFRLADPKQQYRMLPEFAWLDPIKTTKQAIVLDMIAKAIMMKNNIKMPMRNASVFLI
jgi:hypothetical protein